MTDYFTYKNNLPEHILYGLAKTEACQIEIHLHDAYEIFMALSDNIKYFIEGQVYDLSKGDIIITNELELHRPLVTNSSPYERCFIQFKPEIFSQLLATDYNPLKIFSQRSLGKGNKLSLTSNTPQHVQSIMECFDRIGSLHQQPSSRSRLLIYSTVIQLLIHLDDIYDNQPQPTSIINVMDHRVKKMLILIENNFQTKTSLDLLCDALYVDKYYMSHLFKEATGFAIMEYVQSKRIQLVKKLILQGTPITEVCYACGFEDYSNFYKTFKKLVKCSPKNYRDNMHSFNL